jgi:hypothetical protein
VLLTVAYKIVNKCKCSRAPWLVVSVITIEPMFEGSNPAEDDGILRAIKIRDLPSGLLL